MHGIYKLQGDPKLIGSFVFVISQLSQYFEIVHFAQFLTTQLSLCGFFSFINVGSKEHNKIQVSNERADTELYVNTGKTRFGC
jgi:hypothetical protein